VSKLMALMKADVRAKAAHNAKARIKSKAKAKNRR
jgi:hypothetical protein